MRKRHVAAAAALSLLCAATLLAQSQHVNNARGFNTNGVYSSFDVDNINHFNGNLVISIPLGHAYPVNRELSYSLRLIYNSFIWSRESVCMGGDDSTFTTYYNPLTSLHRRRICSSFKVCQNGEIEQYAQPPIINPYALLREGKQPEADERCQPSTTINPASNAGVGWQMHLGKLFRPRGDVRTVTRVGTEKLYEVYQSPDGSDHQFYDNLHEDEADTSPDVFYTRDGSYLRMWRNPNAPIADTYPNGAYTYVIDFPNGEKHYFQRIRVFDGLRFESGWTSLPQYEDVLVKIEDQFGNFVKLDYFDDAADADVVRDNRWEITDSVGRKHTASFIKSGSATLIDTIDLETFNGSRDLYDLDYAENQPTDISRPHARQDFGIPGYNADGSGTMLLPFLTAVKLPDGSQYSMPFATHYMPHIEQVGALAPGALAKLTLPTGGRIEWDYKTDADDGTGYFFSEGMSGRQHARLAPGVRRRRLYDAGSNGGTLLGTWKYDPQLGPKWPDGCQGLSDPCGSHHIVNRVTLPTGDYTDYYFSVYPHPDPGSGAEGRSLTQPHVADYGLPFSKDPRNAGELAPVASDHSGKPLFISSIIYNAAGQIKRKTYVRYEGDKYTFTDGFGNPAEYNPRPVASRTEYHNDYPNNFVYYEEVQYSDFDGLGHYRMTRTFGNLGNDERTEITNYNPGRGTYLIDPATNARDTRVGDFYTPFPEAQPWVLGNYARTINSQFGTRSVTYFNFNQQGQLINKRASKEIESDSADYSDINFDPEDAPVTLRPHDVMVSYAYAANGNPSTENYFGGGRRGGLSETEMFPALGDAVSEYKIIYGYQCQRPGGGQGATGVLSNKTYAVGPGEASFKQVDDVIDCSSGLVKLSRDSAGVATQYLYGDMGRLTNILRQQGSYDQIQYHPYGAGGNTGPARATVRRRANGDFDSSALLSEDVYIYDSLGRLQTEKKRQPGQQYQARHMNYNAMGWVTDVTEWIEETAGGANKKTVYGGFDPFGRPSSITLPDGKLVTVGYKGVREVTRTAGVGTQINSAGAVTEQPSTTREIYDRHRRLVQVVQPSGAGGQSGTWAYSYNVNGQLAGVSTTDPSAGGKSQNRSMAYDNLGNLLRESHPERNWAQYSEHDTMGNVGTSYDGVHWLSYSYDSNARPKEVRELNPAAWEWRLLKSFAYDDASRGLSLGKPTTVTRYNWVRNPYEPLANVARGKPAAQSPGDFGGPASRAVDGNTDGNFHAGSVTHTGASVQPWWQVDLGAVSHIEQIKVWNRTDCCAERLSNFYVLVSDQPFNSTNLDLARGQQGVSSYYVAGLGGRPTTVSVGRSGRYVRVQLAGTAANYLSLAEVEVFGKSAALVGVPVSEDYTYAGRDGRLSKKVTKLNSTAATPYAFEQTFAYDHLGNLESQTYPRCLNATCTSTSNPGGSQAHPRAVHYNYDKGWLVSVGAGDDPGNNNYASAITYHPNGALQSVAHGNGVTDIWTRDPNYMPRPARIRVQHAGAATPYWDSGAGAPAGQENYKFDGAGNVVRIGRDWYLYDRVGRVVEGSAVSAGMRKRYGYDGFGNILTVTSYGNVTGPTTGTQLGDPWNSGTVSEKNRLSLQYDAAGNALGLLPTAGNAAPTIFYEYDGANMIKNAPGFTYLYGPDDERAWVIDTRAAASGPAAGVTETITLRGLGREVLREYQVTGGDAPGHWRWAKDYVYAGGKLLASEAPGATRHYHLDHLGTPRVITDGAGNPLPGSPYHYFPFGDEAGPEPPPDERLRFTGHERDVNDVFRLDYMHARYYLRGGPGAGKFMSVDPGRDWDPAQPQSWNLYSYVRNNPLRSTDPTGRRVVNVLNILNVRVPGHHYPTTRGRAGERYPEYIMQAKGPKPAPKPQPAKQPPPAPRREWSIWDDFNPGGPVKVMQELANSETAKKADDWARLGPIMRKIIPDTQERVHPCAETITGDLDQRGAPPGTNAFRELVRDQLGGAIVSRLILGPLKERFFPPERAMSEGAAGALP